MKPSHIDLIIDWFRVRDGPARQRICRSFGARENEVGQPVHGYSTGSEWADEDCDMRTRKVALSSRGIYEPVQSEENVLCAIRGLLEANGVRIHRIVERIPWGRTTSTPGIPDLTGWFIPNYDTTFTPRHFWIEVKKPGGKLRPAQAAWIEQAKSDGVIAFKAESVEEMVKEFRAYGIEVKGLPPNPRIVVTIKQEGFK